MPEPLTPTDVHARARSVYTNRRRRWLADLHAADTTSIDLPLHPPKETAAFADHQRVRDWARSWQSYTGPATIYRVTRHWPSFGDQDLPVRAILTGADAIADAAGQGTAWRKMRRRAESLNSTWPAATTAIGATATRWESLDDADFGRLVAALAWLLDHPGSGLFIRQLPIPGVDTKWVEGHHRLLSLLLDGIRGDGDLGIVTPPKLCRVAVLDRELLPAMPRIFAASITDLADVPLRPARVLIVENHETLHALPHSAGYVALHGGGYGVHELAALPWLAAADVTYWGDLDTHGFAILSQLRTRLPAAASVLMDTETLDRWRELTVTEPKPSTASLAGLDDAERETLALLRAENLRLEQERIPWPWVLTRLGLPPGRTHAPARDRDG